MDCLEFRRELAAQPQHLGVEATRHRAECRACAEAWQRAIGFEQRLHHVMAVPVPEGLADRILLRQTTVTRQGTRVARQGWTRIAAGLVMAIGVAGVGYLGLRSPDSLASASVAHLSHEPFALDRTEPIPAAEVARAFADSGVALKAPLTQVTYLVHCPLNGKRSLHLVVRAEGQAVTAMYVPGEHQGDADFVDQQVVGRHREIGPGTLVLLAGSDQAFDRIEAGFRAAIEGSPVRAGMK
ncbi:MAG: DUF3379 family protein [Ahniella sp.]|nr:DUF3379 family protein [Ahniella sp.]